jgi:hypothetical protein
MQRRNQAIWKSQPSGLDDVRAVIIAARGVTISSSFLSGLLETDAHCAALRRAISALRLDGAGFNFPPIPTGKNF